MAQKKTPPPMSPLPEPKSQPAQPAQKKIVIAVAVVILIIVVALIASGGKAKNQNGFLQEGLQGTRMCSLIESSVLLPM
jgi:hypothetical protein